MLELLELVKRKNLQAPTIKIHRYFTFVVLVVYHSLLDTVKNNYSSFLVRNENEFVEKIVYLLKNEDKAIEMRKNAIEFIKNKFNYVDVLKKWDEVFQEVYNNMPPKIRPITQNTNFEFKQLKERLRELKKRHPVFSFILPLIKFGKFYKYIFKIYL